jgi:RimJ/RimL family protein N-acetyltransferase
VGWGLAREAWGKGYAYEGSVAAIDWAFDQLGWREVIHSINTENRSSQVLATRLGSRWRGDAKLPPPYESISVGIWAQTREQWKQRK